MITMDILGKIRRLRFRDGLSISEIVRRTGLSRNTVKSWLKAGEGTVPKYRRHGATTVLAPYQDRLLQWLEADARRAQRDRRTALALFGQLQ
jgi:transposase